MAASIFFRRIAISIIVFAFISSCTGDPGSGVQPVETATDVQTEAKYTASPTASSARATTTPTAGLASFAFPTEIKPSDLYMFYLHGKIIEDQGIPAISAEYGEYQYTEILNALQSYGFRVISEQRLKDTNSMDYALRVVEQVNELIAAEVPPGSITIVGASKGAAIATIVSYLVGNAEVNYVLLGGCYPPLVDEWKQEGLALSGNTLAIYDSSDENAGSCNKLFTLSEDKNPGKYSELVLNVGTGHGILYQPLPEWVLPTVRWASQDR